MSERESERERERARARESERARERARERASERERATPRGYYRCVSLDATTCCRTTQVSLSTTHTDLKKHRVSSLSKKVLCTNASQDKCHLLARVTLRARGQLMHVAGRLIQPAQPIARVCAAVHLWKLESVACTSSSLMSRFSDFPMVVLKSRVMTLGARLKTQIGEPI